MRVTVLEQARMNKIPIQARNKIIKLNDIADELWRDGSRNHVENESLRAKANGLYMRAGAIYEREVLYRKFKGEIK